MRKTLNLTELVNQLKSENARKYDIVVPSSHLEVIDGKLIVSGAETTTEAPAVDDEISQLLKENGIQASGEKGESTLTLDLLDTAHNHLAEKLGIPKRYYDTLNQDKNITLFDQNCNHWLKEKRNFFLRNFVTKNETEGVCRAILSDRFRVIDNYDILLAVLTAVKESGHALEIESADITDKKMYVRFINKSIEIQSPALLKNYFAPNGDGSASNMRNTGIISGFVLSNSEVGHGTFSIAPRAVVLACQNGMIFKDESFAKTHLGAKMEEFSKIEWSEDTKTKNYELIIAQTKDAIKMFMSEDYFSGKIRELETKGEKALTHPVEAIKNVTKALSISEDKEDEILNYFMQGKDFSAFGVTQALTFFAHETADADLQSEVEMAAVEILSDMDKYDIPEKKKTVATQAKLN